MAKQNQDLATIPVLSKLTAGAAASGLPAHIAQASKGVGLETSRANKQVDRVTVVQGLTRDNTKELLGSESAVGVMPAGVIMLPHLEDRDKKEYKPGEFGARIVFTYMSYSVWGDVNDTAQLGPIESTLDAGSELARLCKARHSEKYGSNFTKSWIEEFNFIIVPESGPMAGQLLLLTYSVGSAQFGRRLHSELTRRGVDIFLNRFRFVQHKTKNAKDQSWWVLDWRSFDPENPAGESNYVGAEDVAFMRTLHEQARKAFDTFGIDLANQGDAGSGGGSSTSGVDPLDDDPALRDDAAQPAG